MYNQCDNGNYSDLEAGVRVICNQYGFWFSLFISYGVYLYEIMVCDCFRN